MQMWVLSALIGYLLGSVPVGYLVGKARGIDIRKFGSGATGGTNVLRTMGPSFAAITGLSDVGKGVLSAYVGYRLGGDWGYALGGFFALIAHSYPFWLKFKGGKSVATGAGAMLLHHPFAFLAAVATFVVTVAPTRYVSLGSLVSALVYSGVIIFSPAASVADKYLAVGALLIVYVRHWENIKRLAAGKENKLGQKARPTSEQ